MLHFKKKELNQEFPHFVMFLSNTNPFKAESRSLHLRAVLGSTLISWKINIFNSFLILEKKVPFQDPKENILDCDLYATM